MLQLAESIFSWDVVFDENIEGFRSIVNQKNSYGCEQESQDLIQEM
jgi:hypothetical protein